MVTTCNQEGNFLLWSYPKPIEDLVEVVILSYKQKVPNTVTQKNPLFQTMTLNSTDLVHQSPVDNLSGWATQTICAPIHSNFNHQHVATMDIKLIRNQNNTNFMVKQSNKRATVCPLPSPHCTSYHARSLAEIILESGVKKNLQ